MTGWSHGEAWPGWGTWLWAAGNICNYLMFFASGPKFPPGPALSLQSQSGALPQAYQTTLISLPSFRSGPFPSCLCPQTRLVSPPLPASSGKPSLLDSPGIILTLHVASVPARVGTPALPASVPICNQTPGVSPTQPITSNLQSLGK